MPKYVARRLLSLISGRVVVKVMSFVLFIFFSTFNFACIKYIYVAILYMGVSPKWFKSKKRKKKKKKERETESW